MLRNLQQSKSTSFSITTFINDGFDVEKAQQSDQVQQNGSKPKTASMGSGRLPVLDAIRVICSFIIVCAHLDMLFRKKDNNHRRLDDESDSGQGWKLTFKCVTATVVEGFFNLSGFVVAHHFLTYRVDSLCSSLLSRPFRMIVPLALVQLVDLGLYLSDLAYFNYQSMPSWRTVKQDFSSPRFVFAASLNGPLWVMEAFFYLPYAIFPILSVTTILHLSNQQRTFFFLLLSLTLQFFVEKESNFLDRLVAGMLGVVCAYQLHGEDSEELPSTFFSNRWLMVGLTLPWNPLVPLDWRVRSCRIGAPCAIILFHRVVRRWCLLLQGLIDKLAHAGPYTFQVYIWHHVLYGWAGKTLVPFLTNDVLIYQVACIPVVWALVGLISVVTYKCIESPVARFVKVQYINKYTGKHPVNAIIVSDDGVQQEEQ